MIASALQYSPFVAFAENGPRAAELDATAEAGSDRAFRRVDRGSRGRRGMRPAHRPAGLGASPQRTFAGDDDDTDFYEIDDRLESLLDLDHQQPNHEQRRRMAVDAGLARLGTLLADLEATPVDPQDAATILHWLPDPPAGVDTLATAIRSARQGPASILARWLASDLSVVELCAAAELILGTSGDPSAAGTAEFGDETAIGARLDSPWSDPNPSPLLLVHRLHVVFLALRHGRLGLQRAEESTVERWLEQLRRHIADEIQIADGITPDEIADLARLLAYASEMWRETVPHARPIRAFLERRTRQLWDAYQRGPQDVLIRSMLLLAVGNLRLDDLLWEGALAPLIEAQDDAGQWSSGHAAAVANEDATADPVTAAMVLRALRGPRRRGPNRV